MAPELALEALERFRPGATVLDPMCGSGTVLKHAVEEGHYAIGFDLDPLSVLLSRVACRRMNVQRTYDAATQLVDQALALKKVVVPWIDADPETKDFVAYWFARPQLDQLRRLASGLSGKRGPIADLLRVALSRTIITKERGASLARDVSHSRPHRVADENDYDVFEGFLGAAEQIALTVDRPTKGTATVELRDARRLPLNLARSVDLVVSSPPYLNAIDYMRGHRLSLVWLGHRIHELRKMRSNAVGAERIPETVSATARSITPRHRKLSARQQAMLHRYADDMCAFTAQIASTLRKRGEAVLVVGDCTIQGVYVRNSLIVEQAADLAGLQVIERRSRRLPASSRYLPPPARDAGPLSKRMRSEIVLRLIRT